MSVPADRMRRRTSTVPTLDDLRAAETAPLVTSNRPSGALGILDDVVSPLRETVNQVPGALRDAARDPGDALGRLTAPLPGAGGAASRLGSALGTVSRARLAASTAGAAGATVPLAATMARDEALASSAPRRAGARRRGGAAMAGSLDGTRPQAQATPPEELVEGPERVTPQQSERVGLRGRQGAIIANPNAMSTVDRLRGLLTEFKGSPSLRRLAAEQIMGEDQRREDNFQGAQQENAQADLAQAGMNQRASESFADRSLRADMANQDVTERRRNADRDYELGRADRQLQAAEIGIARRAAEAKAGATAATAANQRTDDLVAAELERDPTLTREQAIMRATALATLEGADTQDSAVGRAGDALSANALDSAIQRRVPGNPISRGIDAVSRGAMNLFGSDLSAADDEFQRGATTPDAYQVRGQTLRERLQSRFLPGRAASDVVLTDANGRNVLVGNDALGGLTPEEYNRRALLRRSTVE